MIIELSPEQRALFEYIEETSNHVFITGRAGTGKSTLLSLICGDEIFSDALPQIFLPL